MDFGSLPVRLNPTATNLCGAAKFRDVHNNLFICPHRKRIEVWS
jgi:hypothetical protein